MSDNEDYSIAAVIGKFYRRNHVEVSDTCIKDTVRRGPLYSTGLQWGSNDVYEDTISGGRPLVKVTNRYSTYRHGFKVEYEMVNKQHYFVCTRGGIGSRGRTPLYGPFESGLEDFFQAFDGPYDNPDGTINTSSSSTTTTTTIDLRTPTKESTPQQGEVQHIETISEEELDRKQLESAQKNRSGQLGEGGKAGYVNLVTPSPDNNNNNVKKRARVSSGSSGSGSSSSGSSEGAVDPNHHSQRNPKRRLTSYQTPVTLPQEDPVEYTRWVSADNDGYPIIMHRDNVHSEYKEEMMVGHKVWLYPNQGLSEFMITGPYTVLGIYRKNYFGRQTFASTLVTVAKIQCMTTGQQYEVTASRLMYIVPSMTNDFMFHPIRLQYQFKTRWYRDMGLENLFINPCDDEDINVQLRDSVLESEHLPYDARRNGTNIGGSLTITNLSRDCEFHIAQIYHPWSIEALRENNRTGRPFWPHGGVLVRYRQIPGQGPQIEAQILIKDVVLQLPVRMATYRLIMHGKEWPEGLKKLQKLSLKF